MNKKVLIIVAAVVTIPLITAHTTWAATKPLQRLTPRKPIINAKSKLPPPKPVALKMTSSTPATDTTGIVDMPVERTSGIIGTVESVLDTNFTVIAKNRWHDGTTSTFMINTSPQTIFAKDDKDVTMNDLAPGQSVMVTGVVNTSTLSVAATRVNIFSMQIKTNVPRDWKKHVVKKIIYKKKPIPRKK